VLSVRAAVPGDAAAVAGVHVRSWQVAYRGLMPDDYLDGLRPEDRMGRYTFGSTDPSMPATTVALVDDVIRGFSTTGPARDTDAPGRGEIFALYVDPEAWDTGIGRRLMEEARAQLVRHGFTESVLWVLDGNTRADRFYRLDGWRPDDQRRTEDIWGVRVDEIRYRRNLA
jgi:ribosomal protein S18 acetylase RimI-like enzyme